jgi:hypothetical protein
MASESHPTTDHHEIRQRVGGHDGKPAIVRGTESSGEDCTFVEPVGR